MRPLVLFGLCVAVALAGAQGTKTRAPAGRGTGASLAVAAEGDSAPDIPVILREVFDYQTEGRRDPFVSLLGSAELRPTLGDLRLAVLLYDESGRRPVAILRDVATNQQYRVTTGMTLGRMRVALITRNAVIFSIEEFGLNRTDSLVLGDTTTVRKK